MIIITMQDSRYPCNISCTRGHKMSRDTRSYKLSWLIISFDAHSFSFTISLVYYTGITSNMWAVNAAAAAAITINTDWA